MKIALDKELIFRTGNLQRESTVDSLSNNLINKR